jgi:hypothetical protein
MEMTGESDPEAIVTRFHQQREHAKELDRDEEVVKSEVRKGKLRKRFLQDKLNQLQFSGGVKRQELDRKIEELDTSIAEIKDKRSVDEKKIQDLIQIMDELLKKLVTICLNNEIKVPSPAGGATVGDKALNILNVLLSKIEQALYEQDNVFQSPLLSPMEKDYMSENESLASGPLGLPFRYGSLTGLNVGDEASPGRTSVMEGLTPEMDRLSILPKGSVSVTPNAEKREESAKAKLPEKKSDSSEEEEAASRNLIKRQSQVLVDAKTRKGRFNPSMAVLPAKNKRP